MSHSLYAALRSRYGPPGPTLAQIRADAIAAQARYVAPELALARGPADATVAVIGAGFAGLRAAIHLRDRGFKVTVLEAQGRVGGRVRSSGFIQGRVIEQGAELIGANHHQWLALSKRYGLGMSVVTKDEQFAEVGLDQPLYLGGHLLSPGEWEKIYQEMTDVFTAISEEASQIPDPAKPWDFERAAEWDSKSVDDVIRKYVDPGSQAYQAISFMLETDQTVPIDRQSYLGLASVVRGGQIGDDKMAFWNKTELFRCSAGNQALAEAMAAELTPDAVKLNAPVTQVEISPEGAWVTTKTARLNTDYVVLAVPQTVWPGITFSPEIPLEYVISTGPAVKYLSPVRSRFWLPAGQAPSGMSDELGMVWEGTDNQIGGDGFELSVFAGGRQADWALQAPDTDVYFSRQIKRLYRDYPHELLGEPVFMDWPRLPWIECGYSCPGPRQVITAGRPLSQLFEKRLAFAGEHTMMSMFGYMEGALLSGQRAATQIAEAARAA